MSVQFRPINSTNSVHYDVLIDGKVVGTFAWNLRPSNPPSKVAIVHDLDGRFAVVPNEEEAVKWLTRHERPQVRRSDGSEQML